jgi:hypothetical protein
VAADIALLFTAALENETWCDQDKLPPDSTLREHCSKHSSASAPLALLLQFKLAAHVRFAESGGRCARTNDTRVHAAPDAADGLVCDALKQGECRVNDAESCVKFQPWWLLLSHVPCETAAVGIAAAKRHIRERRMAVAGGSGGAGHAALALRMLWLDIHTMQGSAQRQV